MNGHVDKTAGDYFDELAVVLAETGMPAERSGDAGRPRRLPRREQQRRPRGGVRPGGRAGPRAGRRPTAAADARTWRWTADLFQDVKMLNEYGAQGWEVDRVDGRVCSSASETPAPAAVGVPERAGLARPAPERARPARPDGWEPCGRRVCFEYFKRPKAASLGPAAELTAPPRTPRRSTPSVRGSTLWLPACWCRRR